MDNKRKIGEEELKRALLMMKYDSRKTLTENVEELNVLKIFIFLIVTKIQLELNFVERIILTILTMEF